MKKVLEAGVEITVKNAEGDADTKATIIHQNSIDYEPKVSVIIPVYNTEEYLRECLDSVVNQTLKEIEIICVDDGSTDSSLEILKEYAQKDNRFTIITQKNLHAGVARNAGLAVARGEYVHFLDSDDWVEKDIYIQAFADIKNNRIDVYLFNYNEYDLFNKKYKLKIPYVECKSIFNFEEYQIYLMEKPVVPWNKIYNKNFIEKNILKFDNTIVANDRTFYFKMLFSNPRMMKSTINKSMLNYRTNNTNSLVGIKRLDNFQIHFEVFDRCKNLCNKKFPKLMIPTIDLFMKDCLYFYNKATAKQKNIIKEQIKDYFCKNKNFFNKYEKDLKKNNWYDKYISINNSNIIPIVFATNEQYAKYINVVIESIIHNSSNKYFYQFYIFYSDLLDNTIESFKYLNNSNCHVTFVDLKNNINKTIPLYSRGRFSKEMWYRLYIPEVLKEYDKVIYLDCDIVVLKDISKLWEIDLGNNYLGACRNLVCGTGERLLKLGLNLNEYFNSGVLIFNNYLWNKYNLKEACIDILYKFQDLECPDQDILNLICQKHVKFIDLNWNFMWQYIILGTFNQLSENDKSLYRDAEKNISLIHYTTAIKPWIYPNYVYASYWYEYAKLCSCFKNSFLENIFSIKNEPIRNQHKIITILGLKFKIKRKQACGYSFAEKIFSVKNKESRDSKWYKVVTILGLKLNFKNKNLTLRKNIFRLNDSINEQNCRIRAQESKVNAQEAKIKEQGCKIEELTKDLTKQQKEFKKKVADVKKCTENQRKEINELKCKYNGALRRLTPQATLRSFVYHLVDHCNLKCWGCDHFAPLAEEKFASVEDYEKDVKRLSKLTNKDLEIIKLMGGEPLLHPELINFMRVSRKYFPRTRIEIVTNGLLLNSQKEDFWKACREYDITIVPTKYSMNIDYDKAKEIAKKYDVKYEYYNINEDFIKTSYHIPLDVDGKQNPTENFMNCFHANWCVMLKNGRLYTCTVAPNIEHFNKHFGYDIPLTERDGIDIHKVERIEEVLEFLAKPIPFCKYCNVNGRTFGHEWGISKKDINEWT